MKHHLCCVFYVDGVKKYSLFSLVVQLLLMLLKVISWVAILLKNKLHISRCSFLYKFSISFKKVGVIYCYVPMQKLVDLLFLYTYATLLIRQVTEYRIKLEYK